MFKMLIKQTLFCAFLVFASVASNVWAEIVPDQIHEQCAKSLYVALSRRKKDEKELAAVLHKCAHVKPQCIALAQSIAQENGNHTAIEQLKEIKSKDEWRFGKMIVGGVLIAGGTLVLWGAAVATYFSALIEDGKKQAGRDKGQWH